MRQQVRVFISSTFNDMLTERRTLMSRVFPRLEALCRGRNVEFVGIDLRWGITEEEAEKKQTVDICLREIEQCRPYFVGIIGHRYGWVPEGAECSVTETEILSGLQSPHAQFYFRDKTLSLELTSRAEDDPRIDALKKRIADSGCPIVEYKTIDEFADEVYAGLARCIEADFPKQAPVSPEETEDEAQEELLETASEQLIGREGELNRFSRVVQAGGLVLLTGERGVGKSAFSASWCLKERENIALFCHIIGQAGTGSWQQIVRRALRWLKREFHLPPSIPDTAEGLRRTLPLFLSLATEKGKRICLVIDGIDRLKTEDGFGLSWLPDKLPENVSVVVSCDEGDVLSRLMEREHNQFVLRDLSKEKVLAMTESSLLRFGKKLDYSQLSLLTESKHTGNPRYLSVLLAEIRHVGRFETLSQQIQEYLDCEDCTALFDKVLDRCEREYTLPVGTLLSLICLAREGLTESECRRLLHAAPPAQVSALLLALNPFLAVQNGAMYLSDPSFVRVAEKRYFATETEKWTVLQQLCDWFSKDRPRYLREKPWLLERCGDYADLWALLNRIPDFCVLWKRNESECKRLWAECVRHGTAEKPYFPEQDGTPEDNLCIATFLTGIGEDAEFFLNKVFTESEDTLLLSRAYGISGNLFMERGRLAEAEHAYKMQGNLSRQGKDRYEQLRALGNLGLIAQRQGRLTEAEETYARIIELAESLHHTGALQIAHSRLGTMALSQGHPEEARRHFLRQRQLCRESGDKAGLMQAEGSMGHLFLMHGEKDAAREAYETQLSLATELQDADGMQNACGNLAILCLKEENDAKAEEYLQNKLKISEKAGIFVGRQNALGMLATLWMKQGRFAEAEDHIEKRIELCKAGKTLPLLAEALVQKGELMKLQGKTAEALDALRTAETIAHQHGMRRLLVRIEEMLKG